MEWDTANGQAMARSCRLNNFLYKVSADIYKALFLSLIFFMTKETSPSIPDKTGSEPEADKNKLESDIDIEDFDLNLIDEYSSFPTENEKAIKKMAARRKIEMYWEKKRLREQLGDFDDADLDF